MKTGTSAGNFGIGRAGQMKGVVARQEQAEHVAAADDGDRAVAGADAFERLFEAGAGRIPQQRIGMRRVGRNGGDPARQDEPLSPRGARAAFVRMPAVHDGGGAVERALRKC